VTEAAGLQFIKLAMYLRTNAIVALGHLWSFRAYCEHQAAFLLAREEMQLIRRYIYDTDVLSYASTICIIWAIIYLFLVLRHVDKGPLPDLTASGRNMDDVSQRHKDDQWTMKNAPKGRIAMIATLKQFATNKSNQLPSRNKEDVVKMPALNLQQRSKEAQDRVASRRQLETVVSTPASLVSGYDSNGESEEASPGTMPRPRNGNMSMMGDALLRESCDDPSVLIGWEVEVEGRGRGTIFGVKKTFGRPTRFKVRFESGAAKLMKLKRSDRKGGIQFTPVKKA
jgi:hypothetical protein